jgi:hypothetical protein
MPHAPCPVLLGRSTVLLTMRSWPAGAQLMLVAAFTLLMQHEPRRHETALPMTALRIEMAGRRPEHATRSVTAMGLSPEVFQTPSRLPLPLPLHRPVWLLPEPQALRERDALPLLDGRSLLLVSDPERIETGWWDGGPAMRDHFIGQAADGSLVWIWRRRLPVAGAVAGAEPNRFLHGRFG